MTRYLLLLPLVVCLAACGSSPHAVQTPSPTPKGGAYRLGQAVTVPGWQITLTSAKRTATIGLLAPAQKSDTFLVVQVALRNTSKVSAIASNTSFYCLGTDATKYALVAVNPLSPGIDGPVAAGHTDSGPVTYEVPASAHQFTIQYENDAGAILATWQLSA